MSAMKLLMFRDLLKVWMRLTHPYFRHLESGKDSYRRDVVRSSCAVVMESELTRRSGDQDQARSKDGCLVRVSRLLRVGCPCSLRSSCKSINVRYAVSSSMLCTIVCRLSRLSRDNSVVMAMVKVMVTGTLSTER